MAGVDDIRRSIRSSRISQNTSNHSSTSSSSSSTHSRTPDHIASLRRPDSIRATIENDHRMRATRRNAQPNDIAIPTKSRSQMVDEGEEEEGDGDVRCLCEQSDYPGHPLVLEEDKIHHGELVFITKEETTEDLAGFFLQCDTCKVWQHGGCVGIKSEAVSPEEYFCEECRAHLHKKFVAANDQKYSLYLPLQESYSPSTSRTGSLSKESDARARGSSAIHSAKRRSTKNSRAEDIEEEQMRLAIEASKGENSESIDGGPTSTRKRGRKPQTDSGSLDQNTDTKHQRNNLPSRSPSPPTLEVDAKSDVENEAKARDSTSPTKTKSAATKNNNSKEAKEQKDRRRADISSRRSGRADRVLDAEPHDDPVFSLPKAKQDQSSTNQQSNPVSTKTSNMLTTLETSTSTASIPVAPAPPIKKGGRPPSTKKGKLGRNQYTRDAPSLTGKSDNLATNDVLTTADAIQDDQATMSPPPIDKSTVAKTNKKKSVNGNGTKWDKIPGATDPARHVANMKMEVARWKRDENDKAWMGESFNAFSSDAIREAEAEFYKKVAEFEALQGST